MAKRIKRPLTWPDRVMKQRSAIYELALKMTHNREDAQDLTQDVLLKAIEKESKFQDQNLKGWLLTITRNLFINQYRREKIKRNQIDLTDTLYDYGHIRQTSINAGFSKIQLESIYKEINQLPANLRLLILLRAEGYSYEELAAILDTELGTIRSQLKRTRDQLAEMRFAKEIIN